MDFPKNTDWGELSEQLFHLKPYFYQADILQAVMNPEIKRISIRATTQAGKSFALAESAITCATFIDNCPVGVLAPTYPKTRKIADYTAGLLASNPYFDDIIMLDVSGMSRLERLRKEVSKQRITWKNMSSVEFKSVDLLKKGMGAMGFGYKVNIVDETGEIDDESYTKIYRMLLNDPNSKIIEIGNPWNLGHFYRHHHSDKWHKIHISWEDCVKAGRITMAQVEDMREECTELEFEVLMNANFPLELEYAVFGKAAIENMVKVKPEPAKFEKIIIGIDPAAGGRDRTVITPFGVKGNEYWFLERDCVTMDERDAMKIAGRAQLLIDTKYSGMQVETATDCVNNRGILDRMKENGYTVREFVAGRKARNIQRFYNMKTEVAFKCAEIDKFGLIHNVPEASKYTLQLRAWTYEVRSDKQQKIVDPEEKSPDYADSFIIALSNDIYHEIPFAQGIEGIRPAMHRGTPFQRNRLVPR